MEQEFKSYIKQYLLIWILVLLSLVMFKQFFYKSMNLTLFYVIFTWILAIAVNSYEGRRLMNYIRQNLSQEYSATRAFNGIGQVHDGFSAFGFLFSNDDFNDAVLAMYKSNYKKVILLLILLIVSYPIVFIVSILTKV